MYLIFDGIDGSGKTSLVDAVGGRMRKQGWLVVPLIEPSYGPFGREIRAMMMAGCERDIAHERELFTKDRLDHVERTINPLLQLARSMPHLAILQDRGYFSYPAYQARHDDEIGDMLEQHRAIAPEPDLTIIADLTVDKALERLAKNDTHNLLFEKREILAAARERYLEIAHRHSDTTLVIDAECAIDELAKNVLKIVDARWGRAEQNG